MFGDVVAYQLDSGGVDLQTHLLPGLANDRLPARLPRLNVSGGGRPQPGSGHEVLSSTLNEELAVFVHDPQMNHRKEFAGIRSRPSRHRSPETRACLIHEVAELNHHSLRQKNPVMDALNAQPFEVDDGFTQASGGDPLMAPDQGSRQLTRVRGSYQAEVASKFNLYPL